MKDFCKKIIILSDIVKAMQPLLEMDDLVNILEDDCLDEYEKMNEVMKCAKAIDEVWDKIYNIVFTMKLEEGKQ